MTSSRWWNVALADLFSHLWICSRPWFFHSRICSYLQLILNVIIYFPCFAVLFELNFFAFLVPYCIVCDLWLVQKIHRKCDSSWRPEIFKIQRVPQPIPRPIPQPMMVSSAGYRSDARQCQWTKCGSRRWPSNNCSFFPGFNKRIESLSYSWRYSWALIRGHGDRVVSCFSVSSIVSNSANFSSFINSIQWRETETSKGRL